MPRLFFALWPDQAARRELAALAEEVALVAQGKPTPAEKIHLTLAFLGEIPAARRADLSLAGKAVRMRAFDWSLDRVGSFRRSKVAWAGTSQPPPQLLQLQSELAEQLRDRGFVLEDRPFAPHLTLARKIGKPLPAASIPPIALESAELSLVVSEAGTGRYTTVESWPLRAD